MKLAPGSGTLETPLWVRRTCSSVEGVLRRRVPVMEPTPDGAQARDHSNAGRCALPLGAPADRHARSPLLVHHPRRRADARQSGEHAVPACAQLPQRVGARIAVGRRSDKVDRDNGHGRLEYDGVAIRTGGHPAQVKFVVIVQYTRKTTVQKYDAGRGQKIGVINAFCRNQPHNKCPAWMNQ